MESERSEDVGNEIRSPCFAGGEGTRIVSSRTCSGSRATNSFCGEIKRVRRLESPVFLSDFRQHRVLKTASFVRANMQGTGGLLVSEYWPYLHSMIHERNPKARKALARYAPGAL
jgi:hypothetical protein